jgi:SAM-dependent methyltransferase
MEQRMAATDKAGAREAWSDYWQESSTETAMPEDNPGTQALAAFWLGYADSLKNRPQGGRLLDLACGGGFVSQRLVTALGAQRQRWEFLALDLAEPAVRQLCTSPSSGVLAGVVADAARPPFAERSIDIVVSQFGVEYAGTGALVGAAAMVAPAGEVTLLLHHREGSIARSCRNNHEAVGAALDSRLMQGMVQLFTQLSSAGHAQSTVAGFAETLREPVRDFEAVLRTAPACAAMPWLRRLYQDIAQLFGRAAAYEPSEALLWLHTMEGQLRAYRERMLGMVTAALSAQQVEVVIQGWRMQGLDVQRPLALDVNGSPLAWQLRAGRSAA